MSSFGLIFDFDGVVVLSEPVHVRAWKDMAGEMERALPEAFHEGAVGRSDGVIAGELARLWGAKVDAEEILESKRRHYQRRAPKENRLVPGVKRALAHFGSRAPIGLATSSTMADVGPLLEIHGLAAFFSCVLTAESVARLKPDPEIYLESARRLGLRTEQCWVFEDSRAGAEAARAAGARVIAITTTFDAEYLRPASADFPDFTDLEALRRLIDS